MTLLRNDIAKKNEILPVRALLFFLGHNVVLNVTNH